MVLFMRFWTALIGLVFVSCTSVIIIILAFASTAALFGFSLVATPFFFFSGDAAGVLENATEVVVYPLNFGGSAVADLWKQLGNIVTGKKSDARYNFPVRATALVMMALTFTAFVGFAIDIAPLSTGYVILTSILVGIVMILIWIAIVTYLADEHDEQKKTPESEVLSGYVPRSRPYQR